MNFAFSYRGNRTQAARNSGLVWSQTLNTRPTVYIWLVPNVPITISCPWRRVCVGAFTCPCSPGVAAWHGSTRTAYFRPTPGQGPAWTGFRVKDSRPAWQSAVRLCDIQYKQRCSHVFIDSQTHVPSQGTEFVMNFALRYRGNRTHAARNSGLVWSQTLSTRPTVYIWLVPNVPITCDGNIRYQSYIHGWPSG